MSAQPWKRIEPTTVQKIGYRTIVTKTFVLPDGSVKDFAINAKRNGVAVIAITSDGKVLIVREYRPGPECIMDGIPGGMLDSGEENNVEVAARRELLEETGYRPGSMKFLGKLSYDAYAEEWRYYFLALDCVPDEHGQQLDPVESATLELSEVSIAELFDIARQGRMTDPGAIMLAYEELQDLRRKYE